MWARKALVQLAVPVRIRIGVACRCASGSCASACCGRRRWPGVAGAQPPGEELTGVVAEREHGVQPEDPLERRGRGFLLAVAGDDRGVQIDHQHVQIVAGDAHRRERLVMHLGLLGPYHLPRTGWSRGYCARPASSSWSSRRQHVESEATDPNNAAWSASTAMSEIVLAPSAERDGEIDQDPSGRCRAPWCARSAASLTAASSNCVLAPDAVRLLNARGRTAERLTDGMLEWRLAAVPVEIDAA